MARTVQLDETKHSVTMLRGLQHSRLDKLHCDFVIKVHGHEYHAHRNILSVGSSYFKTMLGHDTKESRNGIVEMKDVHYECVKSCIDFMYTAHFDIPEGRTRDLLHVAIMMQLEDITVAICDILKESMNAENFYETRNIAEMYNLPTLFGDCKEYYERNFSAISAQPEFEKERKCDLVEILRSKRLNEDKKLSASLRWAGEIQRRKDDLYDLVKLINFSEVSPNYLTDLLDNHPVVSNDIKLYKLVNAPLVETARKATVESESIGETRIILFDGEADCLKSYNPQTDEITKFRDEKFNNLWPFSVLALDSYIYVLCQDKSVHRLNFRDESSKWERVRDMIESHGPCPRSVSFFGSLFAVGGSGWPPTNAVEKYDPDADQWMILADKPEAVTNAALVSLEDSIYCIGGYDESAGLLYSVCRFIPTASQWTDIQPLKTAKNFSFAVAAGRRIFVMGGWDGNEALDEVQCYDTAEKTWEPMAPMINCHDYINAHHSDGCIFVIDRGGGLSQIEKYDIADNKWCTVDVKATEPCIAYQSVLIHL